MESFYDEAMFERVRRIAAKSAIARVMVKYRMSANPLDDADGSNSLIRHIKYLTRCKIRPETALNVISNPQSLELSLELRKQAADPAKVAEILRSGTPNLQSESLPLLSRVSSWFGRKDT
jgi:hypothetical protein